MLKAIHQRSKGQGPAPAPNAGASSVVAGGSVRALKLLRRRLLLAACGQFVVDNLLELGRWLRPDQRTSVDKERRGSIDAQFLARGHILLYFVLMLGLVEARVELRSIQPQRLRSLFQIRRRQFALIAE